MNNHSSNKGGTGANKNSSSGTSSMKSNAPNLTIPPPPPASTVVVSSAGNENSDDKEPIEWWKKRHQLPYTSKRVDGGVKMGFNYWMEHEEVEGSHVIQFLDLLLHPMKPIPDNFFMDEDDIEMMRKSFHMTNSKGEGEGSGTREGLPQQQPYHSAHAQQIVLMSLCGFQLQDFQLHYQHLEFFKKCSSVPFLSVIRPDNSSNSVNSDNPYNWFYNDVRSIGSTLFSPKISVIDDIDTISSSDITVGSLLKDYQIRFELSIPNKNPCTLILQHFDQSRVKEEFDLIFATAVQSLQERGDGESIRCHFMEHYLKSSTARFGRVLMTGDTGYEGGTFILDTTTTMIPHVLPGDVFTAGELVLLIMWTRTTTFDVLESVGGISASSSITVEELPLSTFRNLTTSLTLQLESEGSSGSSNTNDSNITTTPVKSTIPSNSTLSLKLQSVVPLPTHMKTESYYSGKSFAASTVAATNEGDEATVSTANTTTNTSWKLDLNLLKDSYLEVIHHDPSIFDALVATEDALQIMGYLTCVEFSGFKDTNSKYWKTLQMPSNAMNRVPVAIESVRTPITPSTRMMQLELEDGEEPEESYEDDEADDMPPLAASYNNKSKTSQEAKGSSSSAVKWVDKEGVLPLVVHNRFVKDATHYFAKTWLTEDDLNSCSSTSGSNPLSLPLDMCSIDCEMCSTKNGLELTRITIVHPAHGIIIDSLVKPKAVIVDYHTEFSGVTKEHLQDVTVCLADVDMLLHCLIDKNTILIGHSLDTDLKVLQLVHHRVIDTAALFPHSSSLPYKIALKQLAKEYLGWDIQDNSDGHDSIQDSVAALQLVLLKCKTCLQREEIYRFPRLNELNYKLQISSYQLRHSLDAHLATDDSSLNFVAFAPRAFAHLPYWEREALGYRREGCPSSMLPPSTKIFPRLEGNKVDSAKVLEHDLSRLVEELEQNHKQARSTMYWIEIDMHNPLAQQKQPKQEPIELPQQKIVASNNGERDEEESARKRRKVEGNGNDDGQVMDIDDGNSEDKVLDPTKIEDLDGYLQVLYESVPKDTIIMIFAQSSLVTLKKLIAKKLRLKWETQNSQKKKTKVAMLSRERNHQRLEFEWDGQADEARLIEAAKIAAQSCLFIRKKM